MLSNEMFEFKLANVRFNTKSGSQIVKLDQSCHQWHETHVYYDLITSLYVHARYYEGKKLQFRSEMNRLTIRYCNQYNSFCHTSMRLQWNALQTWPSAYQLIYMMFATPYINLPNTIFCYTIHPKICENDWEIQHPRYIYIPISRSTIFWKTSTRLRSDGASGWN